MFKRFFPRLSDNNLIKGANSTLARFGHLNALIDYINNVPPGSGIASVQPGIGITIDDSDPVNPIINAEGGTSGDYLPLAGGTMDDGATINFQNGAGLQEGTTDSGIGGNKGIALRCSIAYQLKWEAGRLYVMEQDGTTIREVRYTGVQTPTSNDDASLGFVTDSRWVLDNGDTYICVESTIGDAAWDRLPSILEFVPLAGTTFGDITGRVAVSVGDGGQIGLNFPNGDIITLGAEYDSGSGVFSGISFTAALNSETVFLYIRGGDLYLMNPDTGANVGALISTIYGLGIGKLNFSNTINVTNQAANGDGNAFIYDNSKLYFDNGLEASYRGYSKIQSQYFIDSCNYTQVGTSAPTENAVYETQVGDGIVTKTITYQSTGHYHITYNVGLILQYMPQPQKVKVVATSGNDAAFCLISTQVNQTSITTIQVSVFTRSDNGNLTNGILENACIDVMWYV